MTIRRPIGTSWGRQAWAATSLSAAMMGLSGCAGTPWGESLSSSFPPAQQQVAQDKEAKPKQLPAIVESPVRVDAPKIAPSPGSKTQASPSLSPPGPKAKPGPSASPPSPYRVTIRLPQADPSAPAEAVTQALRAAAIPFEVETIERVKGVAPPAEPPSVRPAPPPR